MIADLSPYPHGSNGGYSVGQVCNLPGTELRGRLQTCPKLPVTSTPQFLNHAALPKFPAPDVGRDSSIALLSLVSCAAGPCSSSALPSGAAETELEGDQLLNTRCQPRVC